MTIHKQQPYKNNISVKSTSFTGMERCALLEQVCTLNPPLFLVQRIISLRPELLMQKNSKMQTPLHVAAASGASGEVMQFLIHQAPALATHVDHRGRTPLHLACQSGLLQLQMRNEGSNMADSTNTVFLKIIQALYRAAPHAANMQDDDECLAPLQYATSNHASDVILEELKRQQAEERTM